MMGADSGDKPPRARRLSAIDQDWGGGDDAEAATVNVAQAAAALNAALGIDPPAAPNKKHADDNDRTTLSSDLPTTPSNEPLAAAPDNDRTTLSVESPAPDNDRTTHSGPPAALDVSSVDPAPAHHARKPLSVDDALVALNNDRTIAGIGVTPVRASPLVVMHPPAGGRSAPAEPSQPVLQQPEQSPLSFVLRASEPTVAPAVDNHDMSMFVAGLVADAAPVVETSTTGPAMEPLMRRSRKRRQWIMASAIAVAAAGSAAGVYFATGSSTRSSASEAPVVASAVEAQPVAKEVAQPAAPVATPNEGAPQGTVPTEAAAPTEGAAPTGGAAETNEAAEADPATAPTAVAMVEPTAKPTTAAPKPTSSAKKTAVKPKVVATKATTAKAKTATKATAKSTAKKAPAKQTATKTPTKKTAAKTKTATAKKPATKKTATKPGAVKKRTSSKSTKQPTKRPRP